MSIDVIRPYFYSIFKRNSFEGCLLAWFTLPSKSPFLGWMQVTLQSPLLSDWPKLKQHDWWPMKIESNKGKVKGKMKSILCEEKKKCEYAKVLFYPTIMWRGDIIIESKTDVITWAWPFSIGYYLPLLLYPTIAMATI